MQNDGPECGAPEGLSSHQGRNAQRRREELDFSVFALAILGHLHPSSRQAHCLQAFKHPVFLQGKPTRYWSLGRANDRLACSFREEKPLEGSKRHPDIANSLRVWRCVVPRRWDG